MNLGLSRRRSMLVAVFLATAMTGLATSAHCAGFETIRTLLSGGFTYVPAKYPQFVEYGGPNQLGTRRIRLINIDISTLSGVTPSGEIQVHWSDRLEQSLRLCRDRHWIPRIVWGLNPPGPLMKLASANGGRMYGPSSWAEYEKYTTAMIKHVTADWGLPTIEIVVGNEFDGMGHAREAWFVPDISATYSARRPWRESLGPYMQLYRNTAKAVETFRTRNPSVHIKIGGPAATQQSYSVFWKGRSGYFNWIGAFVDEATAEHLPLDFVDWHEYDQDRDGGRSFQQAVADVRRRLRSAGSDAIVSIDEWGFSASSTDVKNRQPISGAFALDFLYTAELSHVDDDMFLLLAMPGPPVQLPALFYKDASGSWVDSHALIAMAALNRMTADSRVACIVASANLHCFAGLGSDGHVDALVWGFNWMDCPAAPQWTRSRTYPIVMRIAEVPSSNRLRVSSVIRNGKPRPAELSRMSAQSDNGSLVLSGLVIHDGDYAEVTAQ
jgi:hypothetical protein